MRKQPQPLPSRPLSLSYLISPTSPGFEHLPRAVRVTIRKATTIPRPAPAPVQTKTPLDCDLIIRGFESIDDPYNDAQYLTRNNIDADFDIDGSIEFGDSDGSEELDGLTVIEPGYGSIRRYLNGYDIL